MNYLIIKSLHIIFVVTWFSGIFYLVRLFIYNREAQNKNESERLILTAQFRVMISRLYFAICIPSAALTAFFGSILVYLIPKISDWLWLKFIFLILLYVYQISIHVIFLDQKNGKFKFSSDFLRLWNEIPTVFLIAIIFLAIMKDSLNYSFGFIAILLILILLIIAIRIYRKKRQLNSHV